MLEATKSSHPGVPWHRGKLVPMGAGWSKLVHFLPVSTIRAFVSYLYRNVAQQFEKDFIGVVYPFLL